MNPEFSIDILLAVYNGEKYLSALLDSVFSQSYTNWRLLVRDDGSTDSSIDILKNYQQKYPGKIVIVKDNLSRLGIAANFGELMKQTNTDYIMFCDQDDIWLPNKIELSIKVMRATEKEYPDLPIMVHTDLQVVDENLNLIDNSMWHLNAIDPQTANDFSMLIVRNAVTGCAMMINRKAKNLSLPIPAEAAVHDWWIAMSTAKTGKIIEIPIAAILYRQHKANVIGANVRKKTLIPAPNRLSNYKNTIRNHCNLVKKIAPEVNTFTLATKIIISEVIRKIKQKSLRSYLK